MNRLPLPLGIYARHQERLTRRWHYAVGEIEHSNMGAIVAMLEGSRGARQAHDLADPAEWQAAFDQDSQRPPMQAARLIREVDAALARIPTQARWRLQLVYGQSPQPGMEAFGGARNLLPYSRTAANVWQNSKSRAPFLEWLARLAAKKNKTEFDQARIREIIRELERELLWSLRRFVEASRG